MPPAQQYGWGCVGGLGAGVLVYLVPSLVYALRTDDYSKLTARYFWTISGLLLILSAISGLGPFIIGKTMTMGAAIKAGIAAQSTMKGFWTGVGEATGRVTRTQRAKKSVD